MDLIRIGRRRRRRELMRLSVIVFFVSFFLAAFLLYHSQMGAYEHQRNIGLYGRWILSKGAFASTQEDLHPYVKKLGDVRGGVHVYYEDSGYVQTNDTGLYMGTLPDNMSDIGDVRLFEGRLPEKEGEVAVTLAALEKLGLSYELGQEIQVHYGKYFDMSYLYEEGMEQEYHTRTYTVVGTLYNYLDVWSSGPGMPSLVVSDGEYETLESQKRYIGFYVLKEEYADVDKSFAGVLANKDKDMAYNSNVYDAVMWDTGFTSVWVLLSVMVIGCCAMVYVIAQEQKKRRKSYYLMRCIGASKLQVRIFAAQESMLTIIPAASIGVAAAYAACAVIVVPVSIRAGIPYFFEFDAVVFLQIAGVLFATVLSALLVSQGMLMHKRIAAEQEKIGTRTAERVRKRAARGRLITPSYAAGRINAMHPVRTAALRAAEIVVCSIVLYNITRTYNDFYEYNSFKKSVCDFVIEAPNIYDYQIEYQDEESGCVYLTNARFYTMYEGFSQTTAKSIDIIEGIKRVTYMAKDSSHRLSWEGMEDSAYYRDMVDMVTESGRWKYEDKYGELFSGEYYEDSRTVWEGFEEKIKWDGADYDSFEAGEQVIVVCGSSDTDTSLVPGMTIRIQTSSGDICVKIAAVVSNAECSDGMSGSAYYTIMGSHSLGEKIAAAEGENFTYTEVRFIFDGYQNAEFIAQQLSIIAVRNGGTYTSRYSELKHIHDRTVHKMFLYGGFVTALFFMFAVIRLGLLRDDMIGLRESQYRLRQIGMDDAFAIKRAACAAVREWAALLLSIPLVMLVYGISIYITLIVYGFRGGRTYSRYLGRNVECDATTAGTIKSVLIDIFNLRFEWYLLLLAAIGIALVAASVIMTKNELAGSFLDEGREENSYE